MIFFFFFFPSNPASSKFKNNKIFSLHPFPFKCLVGLAVLIRNEIKTVESEKLQMF